MPYAKYVQLATVKPNGRPSNRTVVYRGFLGATRTPRLFNPHALRESRLALATANPPKLLHGRPPTEPLSAPIFPLCAGDTSNITVVTDLRSNKVEEIRSNPGGEFAWYFPESREQFRIAGDLTVVSKESAEMQSERSAAWNRMSPAGRAQFAWPTPGFPQLEEGQVRPGTNKQTFDVAEEVTADGSPAHDNFCLVVMDVKEVDHLSLRSNRRYVHVKDEGGEWATTEVNP